MFVTFYSYKGGVGRSTALANVATLLAEDDDHPQKVLVWDFDLEAPGLHKLFPPKTRIQHGFVDMVYEFAETRKVPPVHDFIYESSLPNISVLPAGKICDAYCSRLEAIDWASFFSKQEQPEFFPDVIKQIRAMNFNYVLIDSRTGLNDQAGICTQVLPKLVVILFRLTSQNIDGLLHVVPAIKNQSQTHKREIDILPVASALWTGTSSAVSELRQEAQGIFGDNEIQYIRFDLDLISEEKLFCRKSVSAKLWPRPSIIDDYERLCERVRRKNRDDTRTVERRLGVAMRRRDYAGATSDIFFLLDRRPQSSRVWECLHELWRAETDHERKLQFNNKVVDVLRTRPEVSFGHQWVGLRQLERLLSSELTNQQDEIAELKLARAQFEKALSLSMSDLSKGDESLKTYQISLYVAIVQTFSALGDLDEACALIKQCLKKFNSAQLHVDLATLYIRRGSAYYALAIVELEELADMNRQKWELLTYLYAFIGERAKATKALPHLEGSMLHTAYVNLWMDEEKKARELADRALQHSDSVDLTNWAEFFICINDFDRAVQLSLKSRHKIDLLKLLAEYLDPNRPEGSEIPVLEAWKGKSWNFRELLLYREREYKMKRSIGTRLDIIERLVRQQVLYSELPERLELSTSRNVIFDNGDFTIELPQRALRISRGRITS